MVTFAHVAASPVGKEISKEEGDNRLAPSSTIVTAALCSSSCVDIVVRVFPMTSTPMAVAVLKLLLTLKGLP